MINGIQGFYNPLNSIIKSKILEEKYRATLMNIFRIPLNLYVIIILFVVKYMKPLSIAFLAGLMCFLSFLIGLYLFMWKTKTKSGIQNTNEKYFIFSGNEDDNNTKPIELNNKNETEIGEEKENLLK
jgi:cbb3-type cytochrome oxidase subunit 3